MALVNYPAWNRLIGALVEVRQYGTIIRAGFVEDAMPDSSMLWLAADGVNLRTMYEAALDYQAWVEPQNLGGDQLLLPHDNLNPLSRATRRPEGTGQKVYPKAFRWRVKQDGGMG
jgi:hypothetical protein